MLSIKKENTNFLYNKTEISIWNFVAKQLIKINSKHQNG